ncbi:hypothetical protein [Streptomyces sp. NPDC029554]|uniref:hypothetical protein n=1 Tax=unclassified Streptomyces TaxID=2593676 RepID=UPI0033FFC640
MSAAAVCVMLAASLFGGGGVASATDPADAPPGYAGPFSYCKGSEYEAIGINGTSAAYIGVWRSPEGSGTLCAMTMDRMDGFHHMEVRIRRDGWQTSWYDNGYYDRYAGAIYVADAWKYCAYISGWVEINGVKHYGGETVCG